MGGRIGGNKHESKRKPKTAKDMMRGRTDKFGTLIGFYDVSQPIEPRAYSVNATTRVALLMIKAAQLNQMFNSFPQDKAHVIKAIDAANAAHMNQIAGARRTTNNRNTAGRRSLQPADDEDASASPDGPRRGSPNGGPRRGSPNGGSNGGSNGGANGNGASADAAAPAAGSMAGKPQLQLDGKSLFTTEATAAQGDNRSPAGGQWLNNLLSGRAPAMEPPARGSGAAELGQEVLALRSELAEQRKLIAAQSKMLEQVLAYQQGLAA